MTTTDREVHRRRAGGFIAAVRSDRGLIRVANEDSWVCAPRRGLFAVIDGMGGEAAGDAAAALARERLEQDQDPASALRRADEDILAAADALGAEGMGCVVTAARLDGGLLSLFHVGDTRAWRVTPTSCDLLTRDHTLAAERQRSEGSTEQETESGPDRHVVTRSLGSGRLADDDQIERLDTRLDRGDLLVLCTDGLSDMVPAGRLAEVLSEALERGREPAELVDQLVELARRAGGRDNVTVLAVRREARRSALSGLLAPLVALLIGLILGALAGWQLGATGQEDPMTTEASTEPDGPQELQEDQP